MMVYGETSSYPFGHRWDHDVFLSFRGLDTRKTFTWFLCDAMRRRGYKVFIDDEELRTGEDISPDLLKAIEKSRIAIIVFSTNYASSTWCLEELDKILRCKESRGLIVFPVFYNVEPSELRHQKGSFGISMAKHKVRFKDNKEKLEKLETWEGALREAANLSGLTLDHRYDYQLIEIIVKKVSRKLDRTLFHISDCTDGLRTRISEVKSLLHVPGEDVCMVGIYGVEGIGKTTVAKALFNLFVDKFEYACFLANIGETSSQQQGLVRLQETLLCELVGQKNIKLPNCHRGNSMLKDALRGKKILLILDGIDKSLQLIALGCRDWFGSGSIIIITTTSEYLLDAHKVQKNYNIKKLNHDEASELFSWNAFNRKAPDTGYMEISNEVVLLAKGHPLILKVLGSILFYRQVRDWHHLLAMCKSIPEVKVQDLLRISHYLLPASKIEILLDIACFFKGETLEHVEKAVKACGYDHPEEEIYVLVDKSFIYVDENNRVGMHNLVQEMGRDIVIQESPLEPNKRSRLFYREDVLKVLSITTGSDSIQGMLVDIPNHRISLSDNAFQMMRNLRILILRNAEFFESPQRVEIPNNLRLIDWIEYPSCSRKVLLYTSSNRLSLPVPFKISTSYEILQYKEGMSIPDVSFINFGLHGSNLANEKVDGALGIYGKEEEKTSNDHLKEEEPSTSINHRISENYETQTKSKGKGVLTCNSNAEEIPDDKSNKLILGSSSPATSIYENKKTLKPCRKRKLEEDFHILQVQASRIRSTASTLLIESKSNCCDKTDGIQIQATEKKANEEFSQIKDNMEAFYASIEAESSAPPLPQNSEINRPSEETLEKVKALLDLLSKRFSFLLRPGSSERLKIVLDYLLNLSPEEGISLRMKALMSKLSKSFSQWSSDYINASLKLQSTSKILSDFERLQACLKTNAMKFRAAEKLEIELRSQLANLEARESEVEEIIAREAKIATSQLNWQLAVHRMQKIFEDGKRIEAERDSLRNKVPRLKGEKNGATMTQVNIENEWSNLEQQLSEAFSFGN